MPKGFLRTALALVAATTGGAAAADDARLVTRKYMVGEFVCNVKPTPTPLSPPVVAPVPAVVPGQAAQFAAPMPTPPPFHRMPPEVRCNVESLARVLVTTVKPYSWTEMGSVGSITFDEASHSLVVTQTADVHAHVADLLAAMRRVHTASVPQVLLELVVAEVPEALSEPAGAEAEGAVQAAGGLSVPAPACPDCDQCEVMKAVRAAGKAKSPIVALPDAQVECLMKCVRADSRAKILCRPTLVLTDTQEGFVQVGQTVQLKSGPEVFTQDGMTIRATPKVSADRRCVELRLNYQTTQPSTVAMKFGEGGDEITTPAFDRQEIETKLTFLTGKTLLLAGPIVTRKQEVVSHPVLPGVPYVYRLVTCRETRPVKCRHLILVKATVGTADELMAAAACKLPCPAADCKGCPETCEKVAVAKPARPADTEAARLVAAYHKACADGRTEEALRLAMQALARDPSCFADEK